MDRKERDECMEALWYLSEAEPPCVDEVKHRGHRDLSETALNDLQQQGLVSIAASGAIEFTRTGYEQARQIVRCHRLAERLLADVLGMQARETEEGACEFEHVLVPEIADSICTLLGHPRECPHGRKIPEGSCCSSARDTLQSAIVSLDNVKVGDSVKISYINTPSNSRMHKLSHFGIIPGAEISIHQRYPALIVECGNTQLAMEEDVAREVFVMYPKDRPDRAPQLSRRRWRFGRQV
jgi:DtxR family transcriptional regulator, Mn-dependent transcriptional regulator